MKISGSRDKIISVYSIMAYYHALQYLGTNNDKNCMADSVLTKWLHLQLNYFITTYFGLFMLYNNTTNIPSLQEDHQDRW